MAEPTEDPSPASSLFCIQPKDVESPTGDGGAQGPTRGREGGVRNAHPHPLYQPIVELSGPSEDTVKITESPHHVKFTPQSPLSQQGGSEERRPEPRRDPAVLTTPPTAVSPKVTPHQQEHERERKIRFVEEPHQDSGEIAKTRELEKLRKELEQERRKKEELIVKNTKLESRLEEREKLLEDKEKELQRKDELLLQLEADKEEMKLVLVETQELLGEREQTCRQLETDKEYLQAELDDRSRVNYQLQVELDQRRLNCQQYETMRCRMFPGGPEEERVVYHYQSPVGNRLPNLTGAPGSNHGSDGTYFADDPHRSPPSPSSSVQSSDNDPLTVQPDLWEVLSAITATHRPLQPVHLQDDGSLSPPSDDDRYPEMI